MFEPVIVQRLEHRRGQIAGGRFLEERCGKIHPASQPTRVHSGVEERAGTRAGMVIPVQQGRNTGQELGDAAVSRPCQCLRKTLIRFRSAARTDEILFGEGVRHAYLPACQQLPALCVRIVLRRGR
ncbi:hypothetical protein FE88_34270 [Azospirillum brasilense]|nr:hypothetical protein FE88_34270 [Azospirillum brasilense]